MDVSEAPTASVFNIKYSVGLCILCVCVCTVLVIFLRHALAQVVEVLR